VVVGAGVLGCAAAYWLGKDGLKVSVIEKEGIAAGASGMTAATFPTLAARDSNPDTVQTANYADAAFALFYEVSSQLSEESGIDVGFCDDPWLWLALTGAEADLLMSSSEGVWLDGNEAREFEPLLAEDVVGARKGWLLQVLGYPFCLALISVAEKHGVTIRAGEVVSLERKGGRVAGVRLRGGEFLPAGSVVLAMGPWTAQLESLIGIVPTVYPVRGQLLILQEAERRLSTSISAGGGQEAYLVRKADGTLLAGTTKEHDAGFDVSTTSEGQDQILAGAVRLVPSLADAKVVGHVAGLRPGSRDGEPLVGEVPEWSGLFLLTGHYDNGVGPSLLHAKITRDLIAGRQAPAYATPWSPARLIDASQ